MCTNAEIFILQEKDVPDFPFGSIAFNRIAVFKLRHAAVKALSPTYEVVQHTTEFEGKPMLYVRSINMASKRVKVDFRCANPITIKSPKAVLQPILYVIPHISVWLDTLIKGFQAMGEDLVTFSQDGADLSIILRDKNNDEFKINILDDAGLSTTGSDNDFSFNFHAKILINTLKRVKIDSLNLTEGGMIQTVVNNLNVYIKPVV